MQKKFTRIATAVAIVGALFATGVVAPAATAAVPGIKAGMKIAVIPKQVNSGYFEAWNKGAQKACKEIGAKCDFMGATRATGALQVQFINKAIQKKYDAIIIAASDQNAIVPSLKKAQKAGIIVITSDADVAAASASARTVAIAPSEASRIGTAEVDWIAEAVGKKGSVAVLSASATAANQNTWIAAMGPYLTSKYPEMTWVGGTVDKSTFYGDDDATKSTAQFDAILAQYPNVAGIIAPTTVGVLAAAIEKKAKKATVKVTGLGLPSQMAPYLKDGTVEKVGLWNPIDLGYVAIYAAGHTKAKTFTGKIGSSFKAGSKSYKVVKGGIAYLGDPFTFTKSNIATFETVY